MPLAAGVALLAAACLVNDQKLPCRRDCDCPGSQVCLNKVCSAATAPEHPAAGEPDGECLDGQRCTGTLVCAADACGTWRCRQSCTPGAVPASCPEDLGCQSVSTDDGGVGPGVCLP